MQKRSDDKNASISFICGIVGLPFSVFVLFHYICMQLNLYEVESFGYIWIFSMFVLMTLGIIAITFGIIAIIQSKKAKEMNCISKKAKIGALFGIINLVIFFGVIITGILLVLAELAIGLYSIS